jgi:tetratricopeptide (TPR) repeat protein
MGTKQTWRRKYFFLHLACLGILPFFIFGCLHFSEKLQGQQLLEEGMDQMVSRQYEASMAKNLTVLNKFPHSLADQALFQIGLLYAHPENPNQNYEKSLESFNKILNRFLESRLRNQAQLGVLFIKDVIDKERKIGILNDNKVSLERTVEQQKAAINNLKKKIETRKNADLIVALEETVEEQKKEINQLLDQIEKLKRVDLGIEEKKQKILQQNENIEENSNGENSGS